MRPCKPSEAGFTLLELLVAMAVLALLATALTGVTRFAMQAWDRTARHSIAIETVARVDRTLRRQIDAIVSAGALGEVSGRPPLFFGARDGFGWVARTPSLAGKPGLHGQRVRLTARQGLILESWPLSEPDHVDVAPLVRTDRVRFSYFGQATPQEPPRWHPRWAAGPIPPRLVRMEFPARSQMPPLTFALP